MMENFETVRVRIELHLQALDDILQQCDTQRLLIEAGDLTGLMRVLSRKAPLVQRLHDNAETIRRSVQDVPMTPKQTDQIRALKSLCDQRGEAILAAEQSCEQQLNVSRDQIAEQIQSLDSGVDATAAYAAMDGPPSPPQSSGFDFQCG